MASKIKKGDTVQVLSGKHKGKSGQVTRVIPTSDRAYVQGINLVKRHTRQSQTSAGGIIESERSIHISNLALLDPKSNKPTRVGFKILSDGKKVRVAKRSGEVIDNK